MQSSRDMPSHHPALLWMALKQRVDFNLPYQLTFLLSVCAGGSKALERSAIFWKAANKETGSFYSTQMGGVFFFLCLYVQYFIYIQLSATGAAPSCICYLKKRIHWPCHWIDELEIFCVPSADPHSVAQTLRAQSLVWSSADGLAAQQNKISFN